jgi:hypothetical protein
MFDSSNDGPCDCTCSKTGEPCPNCIELPPEITPLNVADLWNGVKQGFCGADVNAQMVKDQLDAQLNNLPSEIPDLGNGESFGPSLELVEAGLSCVCGISASNSAFQRAPRPASRSGHFAQCPERRALP